MRFIAAFCLIIFLINTGYFGIYQILISRAKWNASVVIRNGDHPERMQILTLPKKDAQVFYEDEVLYKGLLFDVAEKIAVHDSVILYLYPDNEEQNILTQLVNFFKSDEGNLIPAGERLFRIKSFHSVCNLDI